MSGSTWSSSSTNCTYRPRAMPTRALRLAPMVSPKASVSTRTSTSRLSCGAKASYCAHSWSWSLSAVVRYRVCTESTRIDRRGFSVTKAELLLQHRFEVRIGFAFDVAPEDHPVIGHLDLLDQAQPHHRAQIGVDRLPAPAGAVGAFVCAPPVYGEVG